MDVGRAEGRDGPVTLVVVHGRDQLGSRTELRETEIMDSAPQCFFHF